MNTKIDFAKIRQDNNDLKSERVKNLIKQSIVKVHAATKHRFIFELLQNANDVKAKKASFKLFNDRLEFHHYNGKPFDENDVISICDIHHFTQSSSKIGDVEATGEKGIGFKSVFNYTDQPKIYSNGVAFRIEPYSFPYEIDNLPNIKPEETVIILPFIKGEEEILVQNIKEALVKLDIHTMLFLRHIQEIEYILPDGSQGIYIQDNKILEKDFLRKTRIIGRNYLDQEQEKNYFVFQRRVQSRKNEEQSAVVEIAFQWQPEQKDKNIPEKIVPTEKTTQHFVTFPAEKQDTKLNFIINCNEYITDPPRITVNDTNDNNKMLIQETAELLGDILPKIKEMGLLSVDFLNALPIKNIDEYDELYRPLAEKTLELLTKGEYLPTNDSKFILPENAVLAYAQDLTELLSSQQLTQLLKSEKYWVTREITENRQNTKELYTYFKNQLKIKEFSQDNLKDNLDKEFLSKKSDDWLNKFYKYLSDNSNIAKQLKTIPIIRCEDGQMRAVCKPDGEALVWLPNDSGDSSFPTVKRSFYEYGENKAFFKSLGLEQPDINDEINRLLNRYQEENKPSVADNQKHIQHIIAVWDKLDNETQQKVRQTPLLLAKNISGCLKGYQTPENVYLPTDELKTYFGAIQIAELIKFDDFIKFSIINDTVKKHFEKINNIYFLSIEDYAIDKKDWLKIGVKNYPALLPIKRSFAEYTNFLTLTPKPKKMQENEPDGFDTWEKSDVTLLGLDLFLWVLQKQNKRVLIETLWTLIIQTYKTNIDEQEIKLDIFQGFIQWKFGKGNNNTKCYHTSKLLETLQKSPCIPNHNNELSYLKDIRRDDIADWFVNEFIEPNEELFALFDIKNDDDGFPTPQVKNIERVRTKARERIDNTPFIYEEEVIRIETRNRADKNDVRTKLKNEYSNHNKNLFCQMCEQEMPTLSQNSKEYLFYTSPLFREIKKDDWTNYVCLCPTCRTKYDNHIATRDDLCSQIRHEIEKESELTRNPKIEISLPCSDEKIKIRFTQNHFLQLKTVFNHLGVDEDKKK